MGCRLGCSAKHAQHAAPPHTTLTPLLQGWVVVNSRNLGRYWERGPQHTLYLPGVWLTAGQNQVMVLELLHPPAAPLLNAVAAPDFAAVTPTAAAAAAS